MDKCMQNSLIFLSSLFIIIMNLIVISFLKITNIFLNKFPLIRAYTYF